MKAAKTPLGTLWMAASHISNPEDMPPRSLQLLKTCSILIFEEAKPARQALKQAGVTRPFYLFNEHSQKDSIDVAREALEKGETVAYMSDQGSPTLCDPGNGLTQLAFEMGAPVKVVPGPSSLTAAMSACPFSINGFLFTGLLPRKTEERDKKLSSYIKLGLPLIVLDAPYRRQALLDSFERKIAGSRKGFLAFDIGGNDESYLYGSLRELMKRTKDMGKVNFIFILEGLP